MAQRSRTKPSSASVEELKKSIRRPGMGSKAKVLAYGANGSGKTRFCGTCPRLLLLDISEEGDRSIKERKGVRVLPVKNWETIGDAYWYLKSGDHPYEAVALDTITAMHELAMSMVLGEAEQRDPTREKAMPDKRSWGRSGQLTKAMLLAFRNLPMHVIFTAQERIIRDEDTEEVLEITPDLPAGARSTALGCVGIIGRMAPQQVRVKTKKGTTKKWVDYMATGRHGVMRTKDRTNALPDLWREPNMQHIIDIW
jgi:hypothetical protein